jgi:hypothetical protein
VPEIAEDKRTLRGFQRRSHNAPRIYRRDSRTSRRAYAALIELESLMMPATLTTSRLCTLLSSVVVFGLSASPARATELPSYFTGLVGAETASPADIANKNILQLNTTMFQLYGDAAQIFKKNILAKHPVILGLFSGAGGRFILYRPGMAPIEAPQAPIVYQLLKSVGHSTMALAEVVVPYLNSPKDTTWRAALAAYRSRMQSALDTLDASGMQKDWRTNNRSILRNNIAFMDECLKNNAISAEGLQKFAKTQSPLLKKNIAWAAQTQVAHWMDVVGGWKEMLGADWDKTYAASNTIYVARQNNVLFSVLAQFFGPDAINDRLMLIETISFTTTPDDMLDSLTRIIADRSVGAAFFGDYHLMDYELMGGDARQAIIDEDAKRKMNVVLPPQVPFGSRQWPTLITPGPGPKSLSDLP